MHRGVVSQVGSANLNWIVTFYSEYLFLVSVQKLLFSFLLHKIKVIKTSALVCHSYIWKALWWKTSTGVNSKVGLLLPGAPPLPNQWCLVSLQVTHATCTHASNISIQATPLAPATRKASGHPAPGSPSIPVLSNPLAPALRPQGTEVLKLGQRIIAQLEENR